MIGTGYYSCSVATNLLITYSTWLCTPFTAQLQSAEAEIATMRRTMAAARDIVDRVLGSGLEEALAALGFQLGMDQASRVGGGARTLTRCSKQRCSTCFGYTTARLCNVVLRLIIWLLSWLRSVVCHACRPGTTPLFQTWRECGRCWLSAWPS